MDTMTFLDKLNPQQRQVCVNEGNILLKACPGSGKTRTLTYKLAYSVQKYITSKKLNIAITYTNRAADEIKERLEKIDIPEDKVWVGTIHQFCLEFIIRPYTMYNERLRKGYHIIDDYVTKQYTDEIIEELGIDIGYDKPFEYPEIFEKYQTKLLNEKEIDFNDILSISYDLVNQNKFIAENIAGIMRTILVDEYQDTNELQYKILSSIVKCNKNIQVTFVGDTDQAIYKIYLSDEIDNYKILKIINSISETDENGVVYLQKAINNFLIEIGIDLNIESRLQKAYEDFILKVKDRVKNNHLSTDIDTFKQCFKEKEGVVINTFHGVKGEEYTTVIAFGILNGYIPHWDTIINKSHYRESETKKLLYVVCSRAKQNLYLFSEQGRTTQKGAPLTSTDEIVAIDYKYDDLK